MKDGAAAAALLTPRRLPWLVGGAVAALYLSFPAARYNFDGVACAIAVDLSDLKHLVHGNHLGYGILGLWWFDLWKMLGYQGPALFALQALSSLLGAAAVGILVRLLIYLGLRPSLAVCAGLGLAVSEFYWVWSLESQVYPLGAFFLALTAAEAFRERPRPLLLGALHAGAVLGHVGHIMFAPAVLWLLWKRPKDIVLYVCSAAGVLFASYGLAAIFCVKPSTYEDVRVWLLGSAALTLDKHFFWHGGWSLSNIAGWLSTSTKIWGGGTLAAAGCWALVAQGAVSAPSGPRRRAAHACVIGLIGYAVLFISWEPRTPVYRVSDLILLWAVIGIAVDSLPGRDSVKSYSLGFAVAVLGLFNLSRVVIPNSDPRNNAALQTVLRLAPTWPQNAWVVASDQYQIYVPYFGHRRPIDPRYYDGAPEAFKARLSALEAGGEPVFVLPRTLTPAWRDWFAALPHDGTDESWLLKAR
jgi:hypothetical protein